MSENVGRLTLGSLLAGTCLTMAVAGPAVAQSPEYEPIGLRAGSVLIFPVMEVEESYDDNIYLQDGNETDDFITRFLPSITAVTDWDDGLLQANVGADIGVYADQSDDNYQDYWLSGSAEYAPTPATTLFVEELGYWRLHEARGSDDVPATAAEPVVYDVYGLSVGGEYKPSLLGVELTGGYYDYSYDNTPVIGGGASIAGDLRDREEYNIGLKVGYDVQQGYEAYVKGIYSVDNYDQAVNAGGFNRDSDGYELLAGLAMQPTPVIRADVAAGYLWREYDDPALSDIDGAAAQVDFTWDVTPLTDVGLLVFTRIEETTSTTAAGKLVHGGELSVDHELLPNLVLDGALGYSYISYDGNTSNREDNDIDVGLGATYYLSQYFFAGVGYDLNYRDSNQSGFDYTQNVYSVSVGAQF